MDRLIRQMAQDLVSTLLSERRTLALAESCTGGEILAALTAVPGASGCIWGGAVVYGSAAKMEMLDLPPDLLQRHGVVSEPVTVALARNIRERAGTDLGAAVTGWAGPTGAGPDPVGTVYLAVAAEQGEITSHSMHTGTRDEVRAAAARDLLALISSTCEGSGVGPR